MLLQEHLSFDNANIVVEREEKDGHKNLYMQGILMMGGIRNLNGRIYPVKEIRNAIEEWNKQIHEGISVCGELDHPETLTISLANIALSIEKCWMDENNGMGKLKILPTPSGNIARALIESGVKLGVSSRGSGDVSNDGQVSDFDAICVDLVLRPSAPKAIPKPVYEARSGLLKSPSIQELAFAASHDPKAQKYLTEEIVKAIRGLK